MFHAAIGGHGYLGFATDITYSFFSFHQNSSRGQKSRLFARCQSWSRLKFRERCAHFQLAESARHTLSTLQRGTSAAPLRATSEIRAVSSVAFESFRSVKGVVFESSYAAPADPPLPPFPLYNNLEGGLRYAAELMARDDRLNRLFHEGLFALLETR